LKGDKMRTFIKVLIMSFLIGLLAFLIGGQSYIKNNDINPKDNIIAEDKNPIPNKTLEKAQKNTVYNSLEEALNKSSRINFLILGMEDVRSDTIIFASLDQDNKSADLISIPRDTYLHRQGYNLGDQRKINSIYYSHGIDGVIKAVSYILGGAPIHHYAIIDYEGVEEIVDLVGGVEVNVPFHMKYDDWYSKPPLHIDIPEGNQVLNGKESLNFLRYREGYPDGDLGRIKAQQEFLKSFASKAIKNAVFIIPKGLKYIKTDMSVFDALNYGKGSLDLNGESMNLFTLPGYDEFRNINGKNFSYYIFDKVGINAMLKNMYNVK